jgi:hypothetical protein
VNSERELCQPVGQVLTGALAIPERDILFFFFGDVCLAVRSEGGALIWEVTEQEFH